MRKQPGIATTPNGTLTILSISPVEEDHKCLQEIIGHSNCILLKADRVPPALAFLQQQQISVVLCEHDLQPEAWIDILRNTTHKRNPPCLIVTSRLADDRLWAEALNLGAWDVLSKPFNRTEVLYSVAGAGEHWYHQTQLPAASMKMMKAAS
jgi:DNA-binding response OmpR family regulator